MQAVMDVQAKSHNAKNEYSICKLNPIMQKVHIPISNPGNEDAIRI
jgi:hypothetical protein